MEPRSHKTRKRHKNGAVVTQRSSVKVVKSHNGRQRVKTYCVDNVPEVSSSTRSNHTNQEVQSDDVIMDMEENSAVEVTIHVASQKKSKTQHDMLNEWLLKETEYMAALLDFEALGHTASCDQCHENNHLLFRCLTCLGSARYCQGCIVQIHRTMPFHRVEFWDQLADCFSRTSLSALGLNITLGHCTQSSQCPTPGAFGNVTVIHSNGMHNLSVRFCCCTDSKSPDLQLFAFRLFPATVNLPQTAFSFEVLEQFRFLHLEGKTSVYTFMNSVSRLSDDTGCRKVDDRTREFRRIFRQWSHLQAGKSLGKYGPGSNSLPSTVLCPACPQPGRNIESNWIEKTPAESQWLHRQFVHFDANFRLTLQKRDKRGEGSKSLWGSSGFFVDTNEYQQYLATGNTSQRESSDCVDHKAVLHVSKNRFESLEVSGVAGAVCRHECAIPQSFVNLSHGERYINSDYGVSSAFKQMRGLKEIVLSYDIACQYSRRFFERFRRSPALETPGCSLIFAIPKFHLPAHKEGCRYVYSFNYLKKVGRTDGEAIERFWSRHNFLSGSTTRMSPEGRLDTLNDHFADWNWRKLCGMGEFLQNRLKEAQEQIAAHSERFDDLCNSLGEEDSLNWSELENAYEPQLGRRTIYQLAAEEAPTQVAILRQLSERQDPTAARQDHIAVNGPAVALWINDGLELEDAQRSLRAHAATINAGSTEREHTILNRRRTTLYNQFKAWKSQSPFEDEDEDDPEDEGEEDEDESAVDFEKTKLPLPSNIRLDVEHFAHIRYLEKELRVGQAYDALKQLRQGLALRLALLRDTREVRGQHGNLHSQAAIKRANAEIDVASTRYRTTHSALVTLGIDEEHKELQALKHFDINTANVFEPNRGLGRGYETKDISWIWRMHGTGLGDNNWLAELLRVQFLDVKTTLDRWKEEEELLRIEMIRTAQYFRWMAEVWEGRARLSQVPGERAHAFSMRLNFIGLEQRVRNRIV